MKALLLAAAALALALPAAALGGHGGSGNPAQSCKAERTADPAAFQKKYGTNHNGRNAFGKCVSSKSHGTGSTSSTVSETLTGTSGAGAPSCQLTAAGCTIVSTGTATGAPVAHGTVSSTLTIFWTQATSNGQGGFCAPASGTASLVDSANAANTLSLSESGTVCEVGPTGPNVEHRFTGTFSITGGAGAFAGATGHGAFTTDQPAGSSSFTGSLSGTVMVPR